MDIINTITRLICYLDSMPLFIIILLLLIMFKKYDLFFTTSIALTSSSLINCALKLIFKVPLLPHLGFGYAFPSGHTQMATVFFGWLTLHQIIKKPYFLIIIIAIGISIFIQNYHTPIEILAGFISGLVVLVLFYKTRLLKYPSIILTMNSLLMFHIWSYHYFVHYFLTIYIINILLLFFFKKFIQQNKKKNLHDL